MEGRGRWCTVPRRPPGCRACMPSDRSWPLACPQLPSPDCSLVHINGLRCYSTVQCRIAFAPLAQLISHTFSANEQYFSLTTNQPTILSAMSYEPSDTGHLLVGLCLLFTCTHQWLHACKQGEYCYCVCLLADNKLASPDPLLFIIASIDDHVYSQVHAYVLLSTMQRGYQLVVVSRCYKPRPASYSISSQKATQIMILYQLARPIIFPCHGRYTEEFMALKTYYYKSAPTAAASA